jgi:hypothetical protein
MRPSTLGDATYYSRGARWTGPGRTLHLRSSLLANDPPAHGRIIFGTRIHDPILRRSRLGCRKWFEIGPREQRSRDN